LLVLVLLLLAVLQLLLQLLPWQQLLQQTWTPIAEEVCGSGCNSAMLGHVDALQGKLACRAVLWDGCGHPALHSWSKCAACAGVQMCEATLRINAWCCST
jgi:hypothetical protein